MVASHTRFSSVTFPSPQPSPCCCWWWHFDTLVQLNQGEILLQVLDLEGKIHADFLPSHHEAILELTNSSNCMPNQVLHLSMAKVP